MCDSHHPSQLSAVKHTPSDSGTLTKRQCSKGLDTLFNSQLRVWKVRKGKDGEFSLYPNNNLYIYDKIDNRSIEVLFKN